MEKHFVQFLAPGTFVSERHVVEISCWDVAKAVELAADVVLRYGARPYGFTFFTKSRADADLDSKITETSGIYYLGGTVETLAEIERRCDPNDRILIENMRCNGYDRAITNTNSHRFTDYFTDKDTLLDVKLPPLPAQSAEAV